MWYDMTQSDILFIERSHRFCAKYIQSIGARTRTHIALGLLGLYFIEAEIDKKKVNSIRSVVSFRAVFMYKRNVSFPLMHVPQ